MTEAIDKSNVLLQIQSINHWKDDYFYKLKVAEGHFFEAEQNLLI